MNWFKENKFLAGLLGVVIVDVGVLGFLVYTAMGKSDEALQSFESTKSELTRLRGLPIYPNAQNLKKLEEQRQQHQDRMNGLLDTLATMAPPLEQITPEAFQDRLREAVNNFSKDAAAGSMALPKGFYMGFDKYQGTPPRPDAVPFLARQLKAIEYVLRQMLVAHVTEVKVLDREALPEESGKSSSSPDVARAPGVPPAGGSPSGPARKGALPVDLMKKRVFQVTYYGNQQTVQNVLNAVVSETKWFIIPRNVTVKNEHPAGPPREAAAAANPAGTGGAPGNLPGAVVDPATGAAGAAKAPAVTFIVGEEKVEATTVFEVNIFTPPAVPVVSKPGNRK